MSREGGRKGGCRRSPRMPFIFSKHSRRGTRLAVRRQEAHPPLSPTCSCHCCTSCLSVSLSLHSSLSLTLRHVKTSFFPSRYHYIFARLSSPACLPCRLSCHLINTASPVPRPSAPRPSNISVSAPTCGPSRNIFCDSF